MTLFQRQDMFLENVFEQLWSALLHLIRARKISDQREYVMKKVCDGDDEDENEIISQTGDINGG
ncbi:hypothetical protein RhiirA4_402257 [Rhizophagus irregularis]|uniref:Uncharacterized protein n=1 Tax=Rhizophagus irregularis TaxID=588596 RepID=A0A2I1GI09_9GLOM|nr:hypothetical protein RhiirA4_402257 [Rhizophagus irregularis]